MKHMYNPILAFTLYLRSVAWKFVALPQKWTSLLLMHDDAACTLYGAENVTPAGCTFRAAHEHKNRASKLNERMQI